MVDKAMDNKKLNSKFVLKMKRTEQKSISPYNAPLDVFRNEEHDFHESSFLSLTGYTVAKIVLCTAHRNGWHVRHADFENVLPNGNFEREVYLVLAKYVFSGKERGTNVFLLRRSLYGLKNIARI